LSVTEPPVSLLFDPLALGALVAAFVFGPPTGATGRPPLLLSI